MTPNQSIRKLLKRLYRHISSSRRRQIGWLIALMLLVSFAEVLSIGALLPFLSMFSAPEYLFKLPAIQPIFYAFKISEPRQLFLPITVVFCSALLIAAALRLLLVWVGSRLSYMLGADISCEIYRRCLYQPYSVHSSLNSSELIDGVTVKTSSVITVINSVLTLITSTILLIVILITLLYINPSVALKAFGGIALIYLIIIRLTRNQLLINGEYTSRESINIMKILQQGFGGIRDVLIDGSQAAYCKIHREAEFSLRRAQGSIVFIGQCPRYIVEALSMLLIAMLAYSLSQQVGGIDNAIPILGTLALGAQRMLPLLQQAYNAWSSIQSSKFSLIYALELLEQKMPDFAAQPITKPLLFNRTIKLKKLNFRYNFQMPFVLKKVNLVITKGSRVGFIGATGSGKSTMLDIIMGLLDPTDGMLIIDDQEIGMGNKRAWQDHIAHVPQAIFLADTTVEENIAFGLPKSEINHSRVRQAAKDAQIASSIERWPKQYETFVGERGVRLSGGQRQRIGIARALYKQADVIIFDEATSSLDNQTEKDVMKAIDNISKEITILIIAHRLSTLEKCTQIVELEDGGIKRTGSYKDLIG